ncbi:MAG TPA: hypothetical protein VF458_00120 [Ktedonobacteraceae bacterium]
MSNTTVIYPVVTALVKAEEIIGPQRSWQSVNRRQELFLKEFFAPCRRESGSIAEIESIAAFTAAEINRFLSERGFKIELQPFQNDERGQEFGVASVLDLLVSWFKPGEEKTLTGQDKQAYPAVRLGKVDTLFYRAARHEHPIARLKTTDETEVYITRLDRPSAEFELIELARRLAGSLQPVYDYDGVIFPMVDMKQEVDVSWLIGLQTINSEGKPVILTQAVQETRLAMNPTGARAQSAFAGAVMVGMAYMPPKPDLLIDGPFLIWFQRPALSQPLFIGYITEEDWKNPGEL